MKNNIAYQPELIYPGVEIKNHKDYSEYRNLIEPLIEFTQIADSRFFYYTLNDGHSMALPTRQKVIIIMK